MPLPIYTSSTNRKAALGDELTVPTNRVYRYARNGSASLVAGTLLQAVRPETSHDDLTCAVAPIGATSITVTLGSAPVLADDYAQGYIFTNDEAGEGYLYDVLSHPAAAASATLVIRLKDQVAVALTTSSQATLVRNIYDGVNKPFGDPWDIIAGVVPVNVAANNYFWCQVRGPAAVLQDGGLFAGRGVMLSQSKPGAVAVAKQVIPTPQGGGFQKHSAGVMIADTTPGEAAQFSQKAVERRISGTGRNEPDELLVEVSGKATIPERILGYCITPRVGTEYALVYLTIS